MSDCRNRFMFDRRTAIGMAMSLLASGCGYSGRDSSGLGSSAKSDAVTFSHEPGAYAEQSLELELKSSSGSSVAYTTNGSQPDSSAEIATEAINLTPSDTNQAFVEQLAQEVPGYRTLLVDETLPTSTVIRAAALAADGVAGPIDTNTYFIGEDLKELFGDVLVVSLVADPFDLLDYDTGIMAMGAIYDEHREENEQLTVKEQHLLQANFTQKGKEWERPAHLELFDCSNSLSYEAPCGIRLKGQASRVYAQKSFNVYLRESYGQKAMEYALIDGAKSELDGSVITSYKRFSLRSGGNATELLRFRDSLFQELLAGYAFSTQATRPAILFLNGEFYGVYSLIEKYSDSYVETHFGVDSKNVVIVEEGEIDEGEDEDLVLYEDLLAFAERDLSDAEAWDEFCGVVDVQSMADYYAAELYLGNHDFSETANVRLWRSRLPEEGKEYADARWRWMMYDTEYCAGLYGDEWAQADCDHLGEYLETCPLLASAMRNGEFRTMMRERLVDYAENVFEPSKVSAALDEWWGTWEAWIDLSCRRFGLDLEAARSDMELVRSYFSQRAEHVLASFDEHANTFGGSRP